jgi:hypothetical protein
LAVELPFAIFINVLCLDSDSFAADQTWHRAMPVRSNVGGEFIRQRM